MELYAPGEVYTNLLKMLDRRGVVVNNAIAGDLVVQKLNHFEYVNINGTRPDTDPRGKATVVTVLIAPGSKYSNKTGDFKKILKDLPKSTETLDVIIVSELPLTIHIKKQMIAHKLENPHIILEDHDYKPFLIDPTQHVSVPPHMLPLGDEVSRVCRYFCTTPDKFPKILQSDVQAVWLGLRPGMVVKIIRRSETGGTAIAYRYCVIR